MGRISKAKESAKPSTQKINGVDISATEQQTSESSAPAQAVQGAVTQAGDDRPSFQPREGSGGKESISIPLKDGKADIDALSEKRLERLRSVLATPEARRKILLTDKADSSEPRITVKAMPPLFGAVGFIEGMAVSFVAKVPRDVAIGIMMPTDEEFNKIAPLAAEVLESSAPAWLRKWLLSDNAKIGQLIMMLFEMHQSKLAQIQQWKAQQAQPGAKQAEVVQ
jgi:hypothetical protein